MSADMLDELGRTEVIEIIFRDINAVHRLLTTSERIGECHYVARSRLESAASNRLLANACKKPIDGRQEALQKLSAIELPLIQPKLGDLVTIRGSSEEFNRWREALASALLYITDIDEEDLQWQVSSKAIIHDQLAPLRDSLERSVRESSALSAMRKGATDFVLTGVGVGAGYAAGGTLYSAIATGAATKAAEVLRSYLSASRKRRTSKAVLSVAAAFEEKG
jgi:hypothetical protein